MSGSTKPLVIFTTLLIEKSPQALPLGAACVASAVKNDALTKDICSVKLMPFNKEDAEYEKCAASLDSAASFIAKKIAEQKPAIAAFSVFVWNRLVLEKAASILKSRGIICIAGGPEVTANPKSFSDFDFAVTGEGEKKVPSVIKAFLSGIKPGPDFFSGSGISLEDESLENLSDSPYLDGTLDPAEYGGALWELARGCPFKCAYCYESKGSKKVRQFPMSRIEKELELFAKKNVPQVFVLDPTYNADRSRAEKLINLIAKKTPDTFYYFEARAEFIDRALSRAFTKIPCALQIGLQNADENVLRLVNRPFNKKTFVKNIGYLNEEGVIFGFDLIYGLPGDTLNGFKESINFALSLYPNNLELFCLSVLPGTDLYDKAESLKLNFQKEPPYHVINTDKFSSADINEAEKLTESCNIFYNSGRAVPWFNTMCKAVHLKPVQFLEEFSRFLFIQHKSEKDFKSHKEIEAFQVEFIKALFEKKQKKNLVKAACDIIAFNGAVSRKTDSGISEKLTLHYPAEFLDSEYALDLEFFVKNVHPCIDKIST